MLSVLNKNYKKNKQNGILKSIFSWIFEKLWWKEFDFYLLLQQLY